MAAGAAEQLAAVRDAGQTAQRIIERSTSLAYLAGQAAAARAHLNKLAEGGVTELQGVLHELSACAEAIARGWAHLLNAGAPVRPGHEALALKWFTPCGGGVAAGTGADR